MVLKRVAMVVVVAAATATAASAQTPAGASGQSSPPPATATAPTSPRGSQNAQPSPSASSGPTETRPATTTFAGDTGLWFVPTGEVLPAKQWSLSAYRVNFDRDQGFSDVSNWPVTVGIGVGNHAEIFGAWTVVRRIDRDLQPLFVPGQPRAGGVVNEYPFVHQAWSDNQLGHL